MNKNNLQNNNNSQQRGFSLIETIIAIFILVIAVTGPLAAASSSLRASFYARDQVVAFYLAQDVIEAIKNYRDNSYMQRFVGSNNNWLNQTCFTSTPTDCYVDTSGLKTGQNIQISDTGSSKIYLNESQNYFTHNSVNNLDTKFSRTVKFEKINNGNELKVVVTVEWDPRFILAEKKKIVVQENIYNWIEFN